MDFRTLLMQSAQALGMEPLDLANIISYETAGSFSPTQKGPRTQWGQHRGLIQFGEPQAKQYGVDWNDPLRSQLGPDGAVVKYFRDSGWKPGMDILNAYSIVNAGGPGRFNASDAHNGGAPGSVRDKVNSADFRAHRQKAAKFLNGTTTGFSDPTPQQGFTPRGTALPQEAAAFSGVNPATPAAPAANPVSSALSALSGLLVSSAQASEAPPQPALNAVADRASQGPQINTADPLNGAGQMGLLDILNMPKDEVQDALANAASKAGNALMQPLADGPTEGQGSLAPDLSGVATGASIEELMANMNKMLKGSSAAAAGAQAGALVGPAPAPKPSAAELKPNLTIEDIIDGNQTAGGIRQVLMGGPTVDHPPNPTVGTQATVRHPPNPAVGVDPLSVIHPPNPQVGTSPLHVNHPPNSTMYDQTSSVSGLPDTTSVIPTPNPKGKAPFDTLAFMQSLGGLMAALNPGGPEVKPASLSGVLHQPNFQGLPMPKGLLG